MPRSEVRYPVAVGVLREVELVGADEAEVLEAVPAVVPGALVVDILGRSSLSLIVVDGIGLQELVQGLIASRDDLTGERTKATVGEVPDSGSAIRKCIADRIVSDTRSGLWIRVAELLRIEALFQEE